MANPKELGFETATEAVIHYWPKLNPEDKKKLIEAGIVPPGYNPEGDT